MTPPESGDPSGMTLSELIEALMRDRWAGAHALRGEYPRLVVIPADEFASYSATVDRRHQIVVVAAGAGEADVVYVCIKNAAGAYAWVDVSNGFEPVGTIKLYVGALAAIPSGWHICDGTNGTIDLRGKFILGGDFGTLGTERAEQATVIANHSALAGHANHAVTQPGNHSPAATGVESNTFGFAASGSGSLVANQNHTHQTPTLSHTGAAVDAHSAHAAISAHAVTTDYQPASYQLVFIQKVA